MKTIGIICEYNPFHHGHAQQIRWVKEKFPESAVVCIMSGRFVQRGEPAVYAPQVRTKAALLGGADLVLELPVTVSLQSAEGFAKGAVANLQRLGVESLCFGAETGEKEGLLRTAEILLMPELKEALRPYLDRGDSFPAARAKAAGDLGADPEILRKPNDILGVEYCKAILQLGSVMEPIPIQRPGDYHDPVARRENPSATSLRGRIFGGESLTEFVPQKADALYAEAVPHSLRYGERAILARLWSMEEADFAQIPYGSEGLWRRFWKASRKYNTLEGILEATKSKRYTRSRLNRMAMCAFLGLTEKELKEDAPYVRVLGFNALGRQVLRKMPKEFVVNSGKKMEHPWQAVECRCDRLYGLFASEPENPEESVCVVAI